MLRAALRSGSAVRAPSCLLAWGPASEKWPRIRPAHIPSVGPLGSPCLAPGPSQQLPSSRGGTEAQGVSSGTGTESAGSPGSLLQGRVCPGLGASVCVALV